MRKILISMSFIFVASVVLTGCAGDNYDNNYSRYDNRSYNDRKIDNAISSEMNSLSSNDIAQLNKLK